MGDNDIVKNNNPGSIENDAFFRAFLDDDEKAKIDFSATMTIEEQIAKLSEGLDQLSSQIHTQVRSQYGSLLSQANNVSHLNEAIGSISGHIEVLQQSAERLKKQISVPYEQLATQTEILGRLHETSHLLRQSGRFLQIYESLENTTKLPEQASIVYELDSLMEDVPLGEIDILKDEISTVSTVKARLLQVANRDLFENIENRKEDETKECLEIFLNMKILSKCLQNILETYQRYTKDSIKECYTASDARKSRQTELIKEPERNQMKGPGKAPTLVNSSKFRSKLWQSIEWLFMDEFNSYCQQIEFLQRCLLELPLTGDCITIAKTIAERFWDQLQNQLIESFETALPHVQQALQQGLPKLLSIARGLEKKFDNTFIFNENVFNFLEAGYLEKCANNLKAAMVDIDFPNQEVIDALIRVASTELSAACVDDRLTQQVTDVICVSIKDLWNRIERNIKLGGETHQVLDNPNSSQSQNITLANVIYYHNDAVNRLVQQLGSKFSSSESAIKLKQSLNDGRNIALAIIQQLIASIHMAVNIILLSMHREPGLNTTTISTAGPSFYMKELNDFLVRSWNTHIVPFSDKCIIEECGENLAIHCIELFVQNAAIIRPISNSGRERLKSDSHYLELALKPIVPDLTVLGKSLRLLRAMASLLVVSPEELVQQTSGKEGIMPAYIVLFMLFGFAGPDLASPHVTAGWSNEKLIKWLESHSSEADRLELIVGALQKYRTVVRQKNISQYDVVYPLMTNFLELAMKEVASKNSISE
ncbi:conserved oligomeric Golgi complex subunit 5 [Malaya genurostris]|uniref:conserved oligomeric Golgi complex subunit 5 n=1 Tax=Malaya genurostris TaxID=325434 RepID=UPI0026F3DC58|nr:conserved oligomeric Golgi complex subunit 5 [Malaya genurostris]